MRARRATVARDRDSWLSIFSEIGAKTAIRLRSGMIGRHQLEKLTRLIQLAIKGGEFRNTNTKSILDAIRHAAGQDCVAKPALGRSLPASSLSST